MNINKFLNKVANKITEAVRTRSKDKNDYKGKSTAVSIQGTVIQPATLTAQERRFIGYNKDIVNNKYADKFVSELPAGIAEVWASQGYRSILTIANAIEMEQGIPFTEALHKARWRTLFNKPSNYSMYVNKLGDTSLGILKFCLTHGTDVQLFDAFTDNVYEFKAVANLTVHPLSQVFMVNPEERTLLNRAIAKRDQQVWAALEEEIKPLTLKYYIQNLDASEENIAWARHYQLRDRLIEYNIALTPELIRSQYLNDMKHEVAIWGPAFGINVSTTEQSPAITTYTPHRTGWKQTSKYIKSDTTGEVKIFTEDNNSVYNARPKYAGTNKRDYWEYTDSQIEFTADELRIFGVNKERIVKRSLEVNPNEVFEAYQQIVAYWDLAEANDASITEFFVSDYELCPKCGRPVRFNRLASASTTCQYCELEILAEQDEVLSEVAVDIVLPNVAAPTAEEALREYDWVNDGIPNGFVLDYDKETDEWILVQA